MSLPEIWREMRRREEQKRILHRDEYPEKCGYNASAHIEYAVVVINDMEQNKIEDTRFFHKIFI
jgi:hypothetical protein